MDYSDALKVTNQLYKTLVERRPEVERLDAAFRGAHRLEFATKEWAKAHATRFSNFSDNWCGVVGSAPGERTEVHGFRVGDDFDNLSTDERMLWRDWEVNDGPAQASQGFLASTISKRSYALVWGDENDEPTLTWERPDQVVVSYAADNPRRAVYGLKAWSDGTDEFATLYTADEVWKWRRPTPSAERTAGGLHVPRSSVLTGWRPREAAGEPWPLANPLGRIPLVEFPNRPMLGGEPLSDIEGTLSMQNAVNLLWAYLFNAADYASMPARVVQGQEPPKIPKLNENGDKVGTLPIDTEALKNSRMLWLTGEKASIGQWDAAKLDVFTDVIQVAIKHIAAQTRTPIYLIHGELGNVNGETLTGLDAPLNSKVREAHKFYRGPVRQVFSLFALVRGQNALARDCLMGDVQWRNPEVRSDAQVSDAAVKDKQVGWPFEAILERRYGLSQPQIERVMGQVKAEQQDPYLALIGNKDAADVDADTPPVG